MAQTGNRVVAGPISLPKLDAYDVAAATYGRYFASLDITLATYNNLYVSVGQSTKRIVPGDIGTDPGEVVTTERSGCDLHIGYQ